MSKANLLRAVTQRLISTPVEDLPQIVGFLCTSITSCSELLREVDHKSSDCSIQIHKLRTRITSLLQERQQEGRFAGVILAKSTIEAGGIALLTDSSSWVRSLLSCLNKPDPPELKKLCLITLTRILVLTTDHQALVREITTPVLPTFISTSINLSKPLSTQSDASVLNPLLLTILRCWLQLITRFPSTFRPHTATIRSVCLRLISESHCPDAVRSAAFDLISKLHFCAPKNTITTEWLQLCEHTIEAAHTVADHVFRAVIEDWNLAIPRNSQLTGKQKNLAELAVKSVDVLGLEPWTGMSMGCSRLVSLVELLRHIVAGSVAQTVNFPLSKVLDLSGRIAAVTLPTTKFSLKTNAEITREEREELYMHLPRIHNTVLSFLNSSAMAYQQMLLPVAPSLRSQIWDIFEAEHSYNIVREATYPAVATFWEQGIPIASKLEKGILAQLVQSCCTDLRSESNVQAPSKNGNVSGLSAISSDPKPKLNTEQSDTKHYSTLFKSAWHLLPVLFTHSPLYLLPAASRALMDSTAILVNHHEAMLASVLNPPTTRDSKGIIKKTAPSILPFLAASDVKNPGVEALLRPRMPPIEVARLQVIDADEGNEQDSSSSLAETQDEMLREVQQNGGEEQSRIVGDHQVSSPLKRDFASTIDQDVDVQPSSSSQADGHAIKRARAGSNGTQPLLPIPGGNDIRTAETRIERQPVSILNDTSQASDVVEASGSHDMTHEASKEIPAVVSINENSATSITEAMSPDVHTVHTEKPMEQSMAPQPYALNSANDDDEESDFEMPMIDTTLSTSDEEEEY